MNISKPKIIEETIKKTITFWSHRTGSKISQLEARELLSNMLGFLQTLAEWDREAKYDEGDPTA